jgi:hypothetical protein
MDSPQFDEAPHFDRHSQKCELSTISLRIAGFPTTYLKPGDQGISKRWSQKMIVIPIWSEMQRSDPVFT